jgi:putative Mg2+ transporter-C (MgtC) family protein
MDILAIPEVRFFLQLILAFFLGALIGMEREYIGKAAGMRTFSLVAIGSALFTILSREGFLGIGVGFDPSRVAAGIVIGIGFLGAGIIIFRDYHIEGLTTAAALWSVGAIGMAIGCQFYSLAVIATLIIIITLVFMKEVKVEKKAKRK